MESIEFDPNDLDSLQAAEREIYQRMLKLKQNAKPETKSRFKVPCTLVPVYGTNDEDIRQVLLELATTIANWVTNRLVPPPHYDKCYDVPITAVMDQFANIKFDEIPGLMDNIRTLLLKHIYGVKEGSILELADNGEYFIDEVETEWYTFGPEGESVPGFYVHGAFVPLERVAE